MAEQDFLNYASDDGGNVSVPRRLRTRQDSSEVELAYITPEEAGILATLRPGSPHRGPMEVPSYDDFDAQGNYRSGAAMSAAESSGPQNERMRADLRQAGISPQEAAGIRRGAASAAAMGQRGSGNVFGNIRGGIRNIFGGLKNKLGAWAGNMRGGINPLTNEYYTQDEYEQNVQGRRDRATIDRLRRTRDEGKYANDPRGWQASDLSRRLGGLEKQFGIDQPVDASGLFEQEQVGINQVLPEEGFMTKEQYDATEVPEVYQGPEVIPTTWSERVGQGLGVDLQNVVDYNTPEMFQGVGAEPGKLWGANPSAEAMEKYYNAAMKKPMHYTDPKQIRNYIQDHSGIGQSYSGIDMNLVPKNFLETLQDYQTQQSPYEVMGIAQGGRVGYNTGGRVGILGAF